MSDIFTLKWLEFMVQTDLLIKDLLHCTQKLAEKQYGYGESWSGPFMLIKILYFHIFTA